MNEAREKRVEQLTIAPLAPAEAARFSQAWNALQGHRGAALGGGALPRAVR